jgi:GAF domain-containing protein/HAMP domain-containing protein
MKLRGKTLAIVVLAYFGMAGVLYVATRAIFRFELLNLNFLWPVLALSGLFFGVLTWILLQRFVLQPLTGLSEEVKEISTGQDFSRRLPIRSRDEIGNLSDGINHLMELLQKQQAERQRTQDLQRSITQVRAAADISRSISAIKEPQALLHQAVDLIRERFNLYYAGVFLLDETGEYAVLKAGTGEAGQKMLAAGHKLVVGGDSLIGWATANRKARVSEETGQEDVQFKNPWLPLTRSELALPIQNGQELLGALTVQSVDPETFTQDDITVLQGTADSLAIALNNTRLFEQLQDSFSEIQNLNRQYLAQTWSKLPQGRHLDYSFEDPHSPEPKDSVRLPLALRDTVIGNLTLETASGQLSPEDEVFVTEITTQAALALENARLLEETQRRAEQERIISNLSAKVWSMNDIESILSTALQELGDALEASEGVIRLEVADE